MLNMLRLIRARILDIAVKEYLRINPSKVLTGGPFTWDHHGMAARTSAEWLNDKKWISAHGESWDELEALGLSYFKYGVPVRAVKRENFRNEWNIHVAAWAAKCAMALPGDFVEVGAGAGIFSRCIMRFIDFDKSDKTFWFVDRWSEESRKVTSFIDDFSVAERLFSNYRNARLIRGSAPDVLTEIRAKQIAFLYIDLNAAGPEIASLEYLWPRIVPGAMILSDDFGFPGHESQLHAFKKFCEDHDMPLLFSPTGQGVAVKGHSAL